MAVCVAAMWWIQDGSAQELTGFRSIASSPGLHDIDRGRCDALHSPHPECIYGGVYTRGRSANVATARVFRSGNSQAVRLPKAFRLKAAEVEIFRRGDEIVLREKGKGLARAFQILAGLPDDFFAEGRQDTAPQEREDL
jgi:antitoxin VapB